MMEEAGRNNSNVKYRQFWQQHNQPIELWSTRVIEQKIEYIHNNPVEAGFVERPEYWKYNSATNFCNDIGVIEIDEVQYELQARTNGGKYTTPVAPSPGNVGLLGCLATSPELNPEGTPKVQGGENEMLKATGEALNYIWYLYDEYNIGNRQGPYEGNEFYMKTNSEVTYEHPKIEPKPAAKIDMDVESPSKL